MDEADGVPGCDGIVGRGFIITTDEGDAGICGLTAEHARLIAGDPPTRLEFERLQTLENERRRSWSIANGLGYDEDDGLLVDEIAF